MGWSSASVTGTSSVAPGRRLKPAASRVSTVMLALEHTLGVKSAKGDTVLVGRELIQGEPSAGSIHRDRAVEDGAACKIRLRSSAAIPVCDCTRA
jgi:hypothetical protein